MIKQIVIENGPNTSNLVLQLRTNMRKRQIISFNGSGTGTTLEQFGHCFKTDFGCMKFGQPNYRFVYLCEEENF